ncbi:major capsid protein [Lysobacter sp. D1-1-M9]|uniref:major capsid protein n=1 Tax=Novilysobacter longmucuonensis TaxID=3098603 RepID=UPI002FC8E394
MNRNNNESRVRQAADTVRNLGSKALLGATALAVSGAAMAETATTGIDTAAIDAAIADVQTKGVAIAGAVTLMIFMIAAAKWLRRAK